MGGGVFFFVSQFQITGSDFKSNNDKGDYKGNNS